MENLTRELTFDELLAVSGGDTTSGVAGAAAGVFARTAAAEAIAGFYEGAVIGSSVGPLGTIARRADRGCCWRSGRILLVASPHWRSWPLRDRRSLQIFLSGVEIVQCKLRSLFLQ